MIATSSGANPAPSVAKPASTSAAQVDGVDVDAVAAAVQACAGVSGLYAGRFGEIGTYLPGRRVAGVEVGEHVVTVQVRTRWDVTVRDVTAQIRTALVGLTDGRGVDIVIADIDDPPGESSPPAESAPLSAVQPVTS